MRFMSSAMVSRANSRVSGLAEQGFSVYGACARMTGKCSFRISFIRAAASAGSMAFALLPRGFRVKNWNVSAPMPRAVFPMARNPSAEERWQPICSIDILLQYKITLSYNYTTKQSFVLYIVEKYSSFETKKYPGRFRSGYRSVKLVPLAGVEPARLLGTADFESAASTNFATRASRCSFIIHESTDKSNNQFIFLAATKILKNDGNI